MKRSSGPVAVGLLALVIAGCSPLSRGQIEQRADADLRAEATTTNAAGGSQELPPILEQIRVDAAQRAGVPLAEVTLLTVQAVTWADGALGCPEPGMMYTQALVRGYRIRVDAAGVSMTYHTRATSGFVHCPPERAQEPSAVDPT